MDAGYNVHRVHEVVKTHECRETDESEPDPLGGNETQDPVQRGVLRVSYQASAHPLPIHPPYDSRCIDERVDLEMHGEAQQDGSEAYPSLVHGIDQGRRESAEKTL